MTKEFCSEDDPFLSSLLKNRFIKGFDVDLAQSGDAGIKRSKSDYDLILLDLILPGKSGFEVMEK